MNLNIDPQVMESDAKIYKRIETLVDALTDTTLGFQRLTKVSSWVF